ncbi:hydantoinase B/oxoprolinase family protein [Novosphingobium sp. BW1]|uniref:hydantoinase B/oxoprolinase family protein n=1 Tax=Novosphingobium sp. BW1 TaxID=2592621 RepID=UPI001F08731A|nr:hydantoinase B/oxoprolinase family protein [Novosphingobium sp. BW1]
MSQRSLGSAAGGCPSSLGNLLLGQAEDAESPSPVLNIARELTTDTGGAFQWRGMPGSCNVKQVLQPMMAAACMQSHDHPVSGMGGGDPRSPYVNRFEVGSPNEPCTLLADAPGGRGHGLPARRRARASIRPGSPCWPMVATVRPSLQSRQRNWALRGC